MSSSQNQNNYWELHPFEHESKTEKFKRHILRNCQKFISIALSAFFSVLLFTIGFLASVFDSEPSLITKTTSISSYNKEEEQKKEEEKVVEAESIPKPETPKMAVTSEMPEVKTPKIRIDYAINTNINIGMQVPVQPQFNVQAAAQKAFSLAEIDEHPSVIYNPRPAYPSEALQKNIETRVIVRILINSEGKVTSAKILNSTYSAIFEKESVEAIMKWRFKPGVLNGKKVSTIVNVPLVFTID